MQGSTERTSSLNTSRLHASDAQASQGENQVVQLQQPNGRGCLDLYHISLQLGYRWACTPSLAPLPQPSWPSSTDAKFEQPPAFLSSGVCFLKIRGNEGWVKMMEGRFLMHNTLQWIWEWIFTCCLCLACHYRMRNNKIYLFRRST